MLANSRPPHILIVKTSSLGDLVHNLPVVTDLRRRFPDCQLDWVAEEGFADIPALHPAVGKVHRVAMRRWRKKPLTAATWAEVAAFKTMIRQQRYDLVLDTQGLLKSAWLASLANGVRAGYDRHSAREPLASFFYHQNYAVSRDRHAVERNRQLAAQALGYTLDELPLDYGVAADGFAAPWLPAGKRYVVFLTATSRPDKLWESARWIELGRHLAAAGWLIVLPSGNRNERDRAQRLAVAINTDAATSAPLSPALVAPTLSIAELASLLGGAGAAVGVDTGLTHLAAALRTPTIALYVATDPGLTGVYGSGFYRNIGGVDASPDVIQVLAALGEAGIAVS